MSLVDDILKFVDGEFTLSDVYEAIDKPKTTIRGRIYDNIGKKFERIDKGVYKVIKNNSECLLIEGDGRNLTMLKDNSVDCIITDHPWEDKKSHRNGRKHFVSEYECFKYTKEDFLEKFRVLKDGSFLVEIIPSENENNFRYLYQMKEMALEVGFKYYAKVTWEKGTFVGNTGRKAKNSEDIMFFSKGKARSLKIDVKKTNATGEEHFMSGTSKMLPTKFNVQAVGRKEKIHQSEKPVKLYEEIIEYVTKKGEIILDQFAGSGALGVASLLTGRNSILIEKQHSNFELIKNRMEEFEGCLNL